LPKIRFSLFNKINELFGYDLFKAEEMGILKSNNNQPKIEKPNFNSSNQLENQSIFSKEKTIGKISNLESFEKIG
jgi:hypothetical protein